MINSYSFNFHGKGDEILLEHDVKEILLELRSLMASSQSSCVDDELQMEAPTCWCGLKAPLKTSHTSKNPGRKFYACPKYNTGEANCQFFIWAYILALVEEKIRIRENTARKREDDLLLREYEVQKRKDKLVERECVLYKQEEKIEK